MKRSQVFAAAALAGAVTGLRSLTGPAIVSRTLKSSLMGLGNSKLRWLGAKGTTRTLAALAIGELIADKLPFIPNRTDAAPLAARFVGGGLCGAAICASNRESIAAGAVIGGLAAVGTTYAAFELRRRATDSGLPDFAVALAEDALAIGGGLSAVAGLRG